MQNLRKTVRDLVQNAIPGDADNVNEIRQDLLDMSQPYASKMAELAENEVVKEYLQNQEKYEFLIQARNRLISYLPK